MSLLIATVNDLSAPHPISSLVSAAVAATHHRLIVILLSPLFNICGNSRTKSWDDVQKFLSSLYVRATLDAQDMGKLQLEVDFLLRGVDEDVPETLGIGMDACFRVEGGDNLPIPLPSSITSLPQTLLPQPPPTSPPRELTTHESTPDRTALPPLFPVVIIGGTFDHLHPGHKVLLSMASWIASEKIVVGITDDALLKSKSYKEALEPLPLRIKNVRAFLALFRPGLADDIVPITDLYGPTGWDPNIQALVVSKETLSGATAIANHRKAHDLPHLETFVIDVISPSSSSLELEDAELLKRTKMSSTAIRKQILQDKQRAEGH